MASKRIRKNATVEIRMIKMRLKMLDELKKDAEYYLGWNQRKLRYFREQYENIKELKDERTMQLKCVFKSDIIRTLHEIAYIKCFLLDPKDVEAREKIEKELINEVEELKSKLNNE